MARRREYPTVTVAAPVKVGESREELIRRARRVRTSKASGGALVAASQTLPVATATGKDQSQMSPNAATRTWQHAAWGYTSSVPELGAAKLYVGNAHARCQLKVGKRNPDGSVESYFAGADLDADTEQEIDPAIYEMAEATVSQIRAERGGQSELLRSYGEKTFVAGESYLVPKDAAAGLVFDCLSTQELSKEGNRWVQHNGPGFPTEQLAPDAQPIRIWRPDGQFGKLATSSVRSCLEILEELVVMTRLVRASAISRIALSGMVLLPSELDPPKNETGPDGQVSEEMSPLAIDIMNYWAKAVDDPASAAAFEPYLFEGAAEYLDKIRHLAFQGDGPEEVVKRREALERLAQGLDLPVEVVLGFAGTTFANAAQISLDTFRLHLEPSLQMLCSALTDSVLWPGLAAQMGISPESIAQNGYPDEIMTVAVHYDASNLLSRPDRMADMINLWKADESQTVLAKVEMREALGLDPRGGPTPEETAERIDAKRLIHIREQIVAPASDAAVSFQDASEGKAVQAGQSAGSKIAGSAGAAPPALAASGLPVMADSLLYQIAGAAEMTIERSAAKIGAKLRSKVSGDERAQLTGVGNGEVAMILGAARVHQLLDGDPMAVEMAELRQMIARWSARAGHPEPDRLASQVADLVARVARKRLFGEAEPFTPELCAPLMEVGGV